MSFDLTGFGSIADLLNGVVSRIWPDKTKQEELKADIAKAQIAGVLQEQDNAWKNALAQIGTNTAEATSGSLFIAGWRPFVGWTCGVALAYNFVILPFLKFALVVFHWQGDIGSVPTLDLSVMSTVLIGMLGLGTMRTVEKVRGVASGH